ncbi:MAG: sigma-54 dependent transcriptional regulator [Methylococcaceae bacterium]|nr:sigma-54 dependent transcriptional regulator [Methylococcaceae bacterium]MDP2392975.1 sigma-54 dependent transcriptional regulator [Methylococcaceae bacterium]MDP3020459.1 sigma-54 dependent transcriptional regulator [Methylococcaceae bacterium]MDP3389822.1 sigma-54 dependent transcriptional regulator [Methylococcaceae bacterium]MDP3931052.1 sigma-54 dependent transcriptional regulator [Methylococcaceae bacterium]
MTNPLALIVDDEPDILELLEITLNRMNIETCAAETITDAKALLQQQSFDLCLTDMKLPDGNGLELVDYIQSLRHPIPVAVITAHGNMDTAILAMKKGAFDFVSKPLELPAFRQLITSALKLSDPAAPKERRTRHTLLGESAVMREIRSKIDKLARSQAPVYISGESGSGKELVARLIHQQSARSDKAFVAINCGAIPLELMESEFFGHKKGSFTGAVSDSKGLFQAAEGGTLFLDEVADLPQSLQVKLLRAIQEKKVRPVGEQMEIPVDVRILSATHKNLANLVKEGSFRQDLYYRINVIDLHIPPLRQRSDDTSELAEHILLKLSENDTKPPHLTAAAMAALQQYSFPGNVRELENILERALALYDGNTIDVDDLNLPLLNHQTAESPDYDPALGSLEDHLETIERKAITQALEDNKWNKTAAAKQLGLSFRSFRYRLKKLRLED